jgi:hypothetical protein
MDLRRHEANAGTMYSRAVVKEEDLGDVLGCTCTKGTLHILFGLGAHVLN